MDLAAPDASATSVSLDAVGVNSGNFRGDVHYRVERMALEKRTKVKNNEWPGGGFSGWVFRPWLSCESTLLLHTATSWTVR